MSLVHRQFAYGILLAEVSIPRWWGVLVRGVGLGVGVGVGCVGVWCGGGGRGFPGESECIYHQYLLYLISVAILSSIMLTVLSYVV